MRSEKAASSIDMPAIVIPAIALSKATPERCSFGLGTPPRNMSRQTVAKVATMPQPSAG